MGIMNESVAHRQIKKSKNRRHSPLSSDSNNITRQILLISKPAHGMVVARLVLLYSLAIHLLGFIDGNKKQKPRQPA
jgi:hypothetical protein